MAGRPVRRWCIVLSKAPFAFPVGIDPDRTAELPRHRLSGYHYPHTGQRRREYEKRGSLPIIAFPWLWTILLRAVSRRCVHIRGAPRPWNGRPIFSAPPSTCGGKPMLTGTTSAFWVFQRRSRRVEGCPEAYLLCARLRFVPVQGRCAVLPLVRWVIGSGHRRNNDDSHRFQG